MRISNPGKGQGLVTKLSLDVAQILPHFQDANNDGMPVTKDSMIRVIKAFLIYRPDFGYSQVLSLCK